MTNPKETLHDHCARALHWPARAHHLEDLDQHLRKSALLSRALWVSLTNENLDPDERNQNALAELASAVADHASAAEFIFNTKNSGEA